MQTNGTVARTFWQYGSTVLAEGSVVAGQVFALKLAAMRLTDRAFAEYAITRRVLSLVQPVLLLGLGVALPRFMALSRGRGMAWKERGYTTAALSIAAATAVLSGCLFMTFGRWAAFLFYGTQSSVGLIGPLTLLLVGLSAHAVVYAYYRGALRLTGANVLQTVNLGVVPVAVLVLAPRSVISVLIWLGAAWAGIAIVAGFFGPFPQLTVTFRSEAKELIRYSLPRVPGDFALMAMLALPSLAATHIAGLVAGGSVAVAVSLVSMIMAAFTPVGIVLLPKVSLSFGSGNLRELRQEIKLIAVASVLLPMLLIGILEVGAGPLLHAYLGSVGDRAVYAVRWMSLAALPLCVYAALRSVLDAVHEQAVNSRNLVLALATYGAVIGVAAVFKLGIACVLIGFVLSSTLLAALTTREVRKSLRLTADGEAT